MALKKMEAIVFGRVQGIGFRFFVEKNADSLNLTGWVCNQYDGSVRLVAIGSEEALHVLLCSLKEGPPLSIVDEVKYSISDVQFNEYDRFTIRSSF
jgi:acylphosphatase